MLIETGICNFVVHSAHAFMDGLLIEFRFSLNELFNNQVNSRILQPLDDLFELVLVFLNIYEILDDFYFMIAESIIL